MGSRRGVVEIVQHPYGACATDYWVFALTLGRGACAAATNWVACNTPSPSGVGIEKRNGTNTRVPEIGASHTSASRNSTRYLIAGRLGT